ncbi:MAG: hypothetical protein J7639_33215 [Paenibacillaceae bacterium]|nr:hypothetical protein [Paenibacillaceae bacterium]
MIYTQRVFWPQYQSREKLLRLLQFLDHYRGLTHEISFFTEGDGTDWRYVPLEEVERRAEQLAWAVETTREAGFVPVINVLNTIGHSDEGGRLAPVPPWQTMVGEEGSVARYCSCPADAGFLAYTREKYKRYGECRADKYWIDDDVRLQGHLPVRWGCFCPACVASFLQMSSPDTPLTREELVARLKRDSGSRSLWLDRNRRVVHELLHACAEGITQAHPQAEIGLMTVDLASYSDARVDLRDWFDQLLGGGRTDGTSKAGGWLRPGGGFWTDEQPRELLVKTHQVAMACAALPPDIRSTYEVENYPYTIGAKSAAVTGLECLLTVLATGVEGIMFNVLDMAGNPLEPYRNWLDALAVHEPLLEQAQAIVAGSVPVGWCTPYSRDHFVHLPAGDDLLAMRAPHYRSALSLMGTGLPFSGGGPQDGGSLLSGQAARGMSDGELIALCEQLLLMDGEAAQIYVERQLGELIGIRDVAGYREGVYERFTDHPCNGGYEDYIRAATLTYYGLQSYALQPAEQAGERMEIMSRLFDVSGELLGAAMTLFRPAGKPPVAVLGHMPWHHVLSPQRIRQLQRLSERMLAPSIPLQWSCEGPITVWLKRKQDRCVMIVFNPGFDTCTDFYAWSESGGQPHPVMATREAETAVGANRLRAKLPSLSVVVVEWSLGER